MISFAVNSPLTAGALSFACNRCDIVSVCAAQRVTSKADAPSATPGRCFGLRVHRQAANILSLHERALLKGLRFVLAAWKWFNAAAAQNRSIVVDNRCGVSFSDYDTPEYATYPTTQV